MAGLGSSPNHVAVNGTIDVYNQCFGPGDCTALVNFWRSMSNLTINVAGKGGCQFGEFWATSQATSLRRVHVNGFATLMDYCSSPAFASGGFMADSQFSGSVVVNGSQQQYLVRDSDIDFWTNGVWNQVFAGVVGAPAQGFPNPPYTTLDRNPESREKPFLYVDANDRFNVFVPDVRFNSRGTTWQNGQTTGLLFDAGPVNSPVLLQVGTQHAANGEAREHNGWSDPNDPTALHDVYFRIGGAHVGKATVSLEVNADNTILDNIWAWRADHGTGVGWTSNTADTGVVVNGDNVSATGLFVEHYQNYEVIWNGENGRTIMFQNEMPYDPPNQAAWQHDGTLGFAAYKVADSVKTHEGWGLGSYCFFNVDPTIHASRAFEVPVTPGVTLHDILSLSITNHGTIDHVVNDFGPPTNANTSPSNVVAYP